MRGIERAIARALEGDTAAIEEVYSVYAPRLLGYFTKHGLSRGQAEDAVQETWVRTLDALSRGRIRKESFEGWLITTARNVRVDAIRGAQRGRRHDSEGLETVRSHDPIGPEEKRELVRDVERAINELPEILRTPLLLRHRQRLSYREIAAHLGTTVNVVGVRIHRARRRLQERLQEHLEE